jgi:alpha,alpha-trehalose phosphorylase
MDLADVAGNVADGVHIASAGGVWQSLVFGFGGVREFDGALSITPHLPEQWDLLEFSLRFRRRLVRVRLTHEIETFTLQEGEPLALTIRGERCVLTAGRPVEIPARSEEPVDDAPRLAPGAAV